jgi:hypothetical protein
MKTIRKCALAGAALLVASFTIGSTAALAQFVRPLPLKLINGWTTTAYGTSNPTVEEVSGIVQFRGAIGTSGTNPEAFILPTQFWPAATVYVAIDLCSATNGRLEIQPNGVVNVEPEGAFSNAQCFTSLDGASYAKSATGFHALTLRNGWTNAPFSTRNAAVKSIAGIVHFEGAIATAGTNAEPFVLPAAFRPAADVYVPVDLCDASNGRLIISTNGDVSVQAENGTFSNAQCFTSLEGVWFVQGTGSTPLTLINGWIETGFGTENASALNAYGIVYFQGAISSGTDSEPFVLPVAFRPITNVYVPVDLCNATNGRLVIATSGEVSVEAENGTFSNAQCFTSLDGVSFVQ